MWVAKVSRHGLHVKLFSSSLILKELITNLGPLTDLSIL